MLLQTNSYFVPPEKRAEHARLMRRFKQTLSRLGCEHFEVYEQVGANWNPTKSNSRFIQLMRFRDRRHHQQIQAAEKSDPAAQELIRDFIALINLPQQQEQSLFDLGFYSGVISSTSDDAAGDGGGSASGGTAGDESKPLAITDSAEREPEGPAQAAG
jgi:hypothetical protein